MIWYSCAQPLSTFACGRYNGSRVKFIDCGNCMQEGSWKYLISIKRFYHLRLQQLRASLHPALQESLPLTPLPKVAAPHFLPYYHTFQQQLSGNHSASHHTFFNIKLNVTAAQGTSMASHPGMVPGVSPYPAGYSLANIPGVDWSALGYSLPAMYTL